MDPETPADLRDILPEPIDDIFEFLPFGPGGTDSPETARRPAVVPYRAYEWRGARFAWTERADGLGQHHGLLIRTSHEGWKVVAADGFPSAEAARAWAARRWAEAQGLAVDEAP